MAPSSLRPVDLRPLPAGPLPAVAATAGAGTLAGRLHGLRASTPPPALATALRGARRLTPVAPVLLLAVMVQQLGAEPFVRSLSVLSPVPVLAALLLGGLATVTQALRWRIVAAGPGSGFSLSRRRAVGECYRASLLNAVLPGGVAGEAARVWRLRRPERGGLTASARSVVAERVAGTTVLFVAVAVALVPLDVRAAGAAAVAAAVAAAIAVPALRRLPGRDRAAVWGLSVLSVAPLVGLFAVAAAALGTMPGAGTTIGLGLVALGGMAVPAAVAGFGPREAATALAFGAAGLNAGAGVATAAAYGVLAAVSTLPGILVMLLDARPARAARDAP